MNMKRIGSCLMSVIAALAITTSAQAAKPAPAKKSPAVAAEVVKPALEAGETINVNTADAAALVRLPGIGAKIAVRIVEYRTAHGGFKTVEDLVKVKGIGVKRLAKIKAHVTVE